MYLKVNEKLIINTDHIVKAERVCNGVAILLSQGGSIEIFDSSCGGDDKDVELVWEALVVLYCLDNNRMIEQTLKDVVGFAPKE